VNELREKGEQMERQTFEFIVRPYMVKANIKNWSALAKCLGLSRALMSQRLENPSSFRGYELSSLANILNMSLEDRGRLI